MLLRHCCWCERGLTVNGVQCGLGLLPTCRNDVISLSLTVNWPCQNDILLSIQTPFSYTCLTRFAMQRFDFASANIAMPNGLYFTAVVFSFFLLFSTPDLWCHWTDLNQTWHIFTYELYLNNLVRTFSGIYPHGLGQKRFWDRLWTLTEHNLCNGTLYRQSERNLLIYNLQGLPYMLPKFDKLCSRNGWKRLVIFAHPLNFRIGRHWQLYHMDVIYMLQTAGKF